MATTTIERPETAESPPVAEATQTAELAVTGMTCASCVMRVEKRLKKVPGVTEAAVNLATERATVTYRPDEANAAALVKAVEVTGYGATVQAQDEPLGVALAVEGMTCAS